MTREYTPGTNVVIAEAEKKTFLTFFLVFLLSPNEERMFCKAWREAYVVLYEDSSLIW